MNGNDVGCALGSCSTVPARCAGFHTVDGISCGRPHKNWGKLLCIQSVCNVCGLSATGVWVHNGRPAAQAPCSLLNRGAGLSTHPAALVACAVSQGRMEATKYCFCTTQWRADINGSSRRRTPCQTSSPDTADISKSVCGSPLQYIPVLSVVMVQSSDGRLGMIHVVKRCRSAGIMYGNKKCHGGRLNHAGQMQMLFVELQGTLGGPTM